MAPLNAGVRARAADFLDRLHDAARRYAWVIFLVSVAALAARAFAVSDARLMHDEYYFAKTAQLWYWGQEGTRAITSVPNRGESGFGNTLFLSIYRFAYAFGDHFYAAAKAFNLVFAALAALAVRAAAMRFMRRDDATLVATLTLWMASSTFLPYFMPEALYEFLVWSGIAAYFFLVGRDPRLAAVAVGAFLGAAFLAKPTPLALLVAFNVVVVLIAWRFPHRDRRAATLLLSVLGLNLAFVLTGFVVNAITTGQLAWDPFGSFYKHGLAKVGEVEASGLFGQQLAKYFFAYAFIIALVFGPAVTAIAGGVKRSVRVEDVALVAVAVLGLGVLLLGSVKVAVNWERVYVNHSGMYSTRYISVLFPLLIIGIVRFRPESSELRRVRAVVGVGLVLLAVACAIAYRDMANVTQMRDVFWAQKVLGGAGFWAVVLAFAGAGLYFALAKAPSTHAYFAIFVTCSVLGVVKQLATDRWLIRETGGKAWSDAARAVQARVPAASRDRGIVVVPEANVATRFMFRFPGIIPMRLIERDGTLERHEIPEGVEWAVFLDNVRPAFAADCEELHRGVYCRLDAG